ncbi:MAG TPA: cobyrinate a,c-diamide synthase [Polyangiaceae bacterium]|nr:cobyrinate a,c-diamide synthase [Polyangiaceae bacterium]
MAASGPIPRIVVAGTSSGVGKTSVVVALVRALATEGFQVAVFKCGPDYLDPTYHARAAGRPCHNLDGWMMGRDAVLATFRRASENADIAIIEGVMGLFDGASPTGEEGSTAEIAKWLGAPVLLVVDASGMARSVAAIAQGFARFDPALHVAGIICNRVGSRGHLDLLRRACDTPPVLGGFPKQPELAFPERHLGLFTADERVLPESKLAGWGKAASEWLGTSAIVELARGAREPDTSAAVETAPGPASHDPRAEERCRIGLAWDDAFHFYYEDNLARLESLGAKIVRFSPIRDTHLPDVDGLYFGGGYPEAHAAGLAQNASMREAVEGFARAGGPIYAECGGLMYLSRAIVTRDGVAHGMVGLLPADTIMKERLVALGYVEVETQEPTILGPAGLRFRGHQFRYSELGPFSATAPQVYTIRKRRGGETSREGFAPSSSQVLASYVHAHFASNPRIAAGLVAASAAYRAKHRERGAACS